MASFKTSRRFFGQCPLPEMIGHTASLNLLRTGLPEPHNQIYIALCQPSQCFRARFPRSQMDTGLTIASAASASNCIWEPPPFFATVLMLSVLVVPSICDPPLIFHVSCEICMFLFRATVRFFAGQQSFWRLNLCGLDLSCQK